MAKEFSTRPSSLLGLTDDWAAYMLDHAIYMFGRMTQNKYDETDKKGKRKHSIAYCLGEAPRGGVSALRDMGGVNYRVGKKKEQA